MNALVLIHAICATTALLIGPIWIFSKVKSKKIEYALYTWIILMIIVSITSFWIREINFGKLSYIHILSVITLLSIVQYYYYTKKCGNPWSSVKKTLHGVYIGLVIAFIGTLLPGRLMGGLFSERPFVYGSVFIVYMLAIGLYFQKQDATGKG